LFQQKGARMFRSHRKLLMDYFFRVLELAICHTLGNLPDPELTQECF
jgi:hypothetical protein